MFIDQNLTMSLIRAGKHVVFLMEHCILIRGGENFSLFRHSGAHTFLSETVFSFDPYL